MEQRRRSLATDEQVKLVRNTLRDLGRLNEVKISEVVGYGSTVVLEFLTDPPQEKRVKLVREKDEPLPEGVDMLVDGQAAVGQKILGQASDGKEIEVNTNVKVRILEIIDPEIVKSPEPQ